MNIFENLLIIKIFVINFSCERPCWTLWYISAVPVWTPLTTTSGWTMSCARGSLVAEVSAFKVNASLCVFMVYAAGQGGDAII